MRTFLRLFLILFLAPNWAFAAQETETVKAFVEAFNKRNVDAMLALAAPDLKWMSVSGQQISTETATHSALRQAMQSYFKSTPSARSHIRQIQQSGAFVYALEEAFWQADGTEKSQCSMAVYELKKGKVQHVWYFAAHQCGEH